MSDTDIAAQKVWEWGDAVIDVLDEIYCKSLITIALIINAHPGLMFTHSWSISSILQPFQAAQEQCQHRPSLTTVDFIALWGGSLWMTPVLGSRSHTELGIKLRGAGSQLCPLIHVFLFPCCHTQTLLPSWLFDGKFCSPYLHSLILQLPFLVKDWIRPVQRDFALPISPDKPFAGAEEHFLGQSTSSQPETESISHYPEPMVALRTISSWQQLNSWWSRKCLLKTRIGSSFIKLPLAVTPCPQTWRNQGRKSKLMLGVSLIPHRESGVGRVCHCNQFRCQRIPEWFVLERT